jgi:hypothetical protein
MKTLPIWIALCLFFTGCAADYVEIDRTVPPYFHAQNVFIDTHGRDAMPRRILVLPAWGNTQLPVLRQLDTILVQELTKANIAEVIPPLRVETQNRRPQQEFTIDEARYWAQQTGADGVMLCRVSSCSPHKPLSLGVNLRIWNFPQSLTAWSVDETLDSQLTTVANGARNYYLSNFREPFPTRKSEHILQSPNMFFQYCFAEIFSTLPGNQAPPRTEDELLPPLKK